MNNTIKTLLTALFILSLAVELTFTLGQLTRQYVLPAVVFIATAVYHYGMLTFDWACDTIDMELNVIRTPMTTGYAHA